MYRSPGLMGWLNTTPKKQVQNGRGLLLEVDRDGKNQGAQRDARQIAQIKDTGYLSERSNAIPSATLPPIFQNEEENQDDNEPSELDGIETMPQAGSGMLPADLIKIKILKKKAVKTGATAAGRIAAITAVIKNIEPRAAAQVKSNLSQFRGALSRGDPKSLKNTAALVASMALPILKINGVRILKKDLQNLIAAAI